MRHGVVLSEESIYQHLVAIVEDLKAARLARADVNLSALAFERLAEAIPLGLPELWVPFGRARVCDTGMHVAVCEDAVK
jgi:hypothetical protein